MRAREWTIAYLYYEDEYLPPIPDEFVWVEEDDGDRYSIHGGGGGDEWVSAADTWDVKR